MNYSRQTILILLISSILGCSKAPNPEEQTRDLVANITIAIIEYGISGPGLVTTDNQQIFSVLTGATPSQRQVYFPYKNSREARRFLDFWEQELKFFRNRDGNIIAWSLGADGLFLTADDIYGDEYPVVKQNLNLANEAARKKALR